MIYDTDVNASLKNLELKMAASEALGPSSRSVHTYCHGAAFCSARDMAMTINETKGERNHMNRNAAFPSEYLKTDEVSGKGEKFIMADVELVEFQDPKTQEKESKPVLSFEDSEKSLILNKTNWDRIAKLHGPDSKSWKGKSIILRLESVEAFGKNQDAIRVKE